MKRINIALAFAILVTLLESCVTLSGRPTLAGVNANIPTLCGHHSPPDARRHGAHVKIKLASIDHPLTYNCLLQKAAENHTGITTAHHLITDAASFKTDIESYLSSAGELSQIGIDYRRKLNGKISYVVYLAD